VPRCVQYSLHAAACAASVLSVLLHLEVSIYKSFVLHLHMSFYKSFVLHLDVSAYNSFVLHPDVSVYKSLCCICACLSIRA
jgi:hypothetical protein